MIMEIKLFLRKEKQPIFWLKEDFVSKNLNFDYEKSKNFLIQQNLDKEKQCKLIEEFIKTI